MCRSSESITRLIRRAAARDRVCRKKAGDSDLVILTLEIDEEGNLSATAEYEDHEVKSKNVAIPDLYDTHNVIAQARLDMVGVDYSPHGEILEPMRPGIPIKFIWSVLPRSVGSYRGTIWVHLQFVPLDGSDPTRTALSAQVIDINAVNLIGLGGTPARVIGSVGAVIGAFLSLDKLGGALWRTFKSIVLRPKREGE